MQAVIFDFAHNVTYVSNASPAPNAVPAYNRPFFKLDMAKLFEEKF